MKPLDLLRQGVPPLLLLPLFDAAWDASGLVWWMLGALAALISLTTLLLGISQRPAEQPLIRWDTMLRPLLTILIVGGAGGVGLLVQSNAEHYVASLAASLQRACRDAGRCPAAPAGWVAQGKYAQARAGHWQLTYVADAAGDRYGLWIAKGPDNEVCIDGGKTAALREIGSMRCKTDARVPSGAF